MVKLSLEEFKELSLAVDGFIDDLVPQINYALKEKEQILAPAQCTVTINSKFYIVSVNIFVYKDSYNYNICLIQESDADTYLDSLNNDLRKRD